MVNDVPGGPEMLREGIQLIDSVPGGQNAISQIASAAGAQHMGNCMMQNGAVLFGAPGI